MRYLRDFPFSARQGLCGIIDHSRIGNWGADGQRHKEHANQFNDNTRFYGRGKCNYGFENMTPEEQAKLFDVLLIDLKATIGVHEDPGRPNRGKEVDTYCRFLGLIAVAWCACYVAFKIWKAAKNAGVGNPWPIVASAASCSWLGSWAANNNRLHSSPNQDIFVFLIPKVGGGYQHTGFGFNWRKELNPKTGAVGYCFDTNEGNSNTNGSSDGYEVVDNRRFDKLGIKYIQIAI